LLLFADAAALRRIRLIQITLGGEVVDQRILDALHDVFPSARIVHVYATTELGRCFSVTDGRAGFPVRYLTEPSADGVELRVDDGELIVRSANAMQGYDRAGAPASAPAMDYRTGDLVEISGDRVYFVGRLTDTINVGGNKVHPVEVERVLRAVPGVADVRVFAKRSSIAGELVACHVVPDEGIDIEQLRKRLMTICLDHLNSFQRPRAIEFVSEIALESSGKMSRSAVQP
jgi:acyl-CoA synthetase (AMP-forming)/AMP-acid ligase II